MCSVDSGPPDLLLDFVDGCQEEEYLREIKQRSIEDWLLSETEYGDGNVVIDEEDYLWTQVDIWRWT